MSSEGGLVGVLDVRCIQCDAKPRDECTGEGEGYHLSRWDAAHEANETADRLGIMEGGQ